MSKAGVTAGRAAASEMKVCARDQWTRVRTWG